MKTKFFILLVLACTVLKTANASPWTYKCIDNECVRTIAENSTRYGMSACRLTCGPYRTLWPMPSRPIQLSNKLVSFCVDRFNLNLQTKQDSPLLNEMLGDFEHKLRTMMPRRAGTQCRSPVSGVTLRVSVKSRKSDATESSQLRMDTYEGYYVQIDLTDDSMMFYVDASNAFGLRHGLETIKQLIAKDEAYGCLVSLSEAIIVDEPKYAYRGVMLDTSRNYVSLTSLRRLIDVMSTFKLNTFHWHITDSHSFPYYTPIMPQMAQYGAYSRRMVYTRDDVADLTHYATKRGVRILPEIDSPAHTGYGWQWGEKAGFGKLVLCEGLSPWDTYCLQPPCGQLNIINPNVLNIMEELFADLYGSTNTELFHLGADEVKLVCWNSTEEILNYLKQKNMDNSEKSFFDLWGNFTKDLHARLRIANKRINPLAKKTDAIFWTSTLTTKDHLTKYYNLDETIIMYWENWGQKVLLEELIAAKVRLILANHERNYLDCGFGHYVNDGNIWCSPYKHWTSIYENDFTRSLEDLGLNSAENRRLVQGGQVALWLEIGDDMSVFFKLLPRLIAAAERWWSFPTGNVTAEAMSRYDFVQKRLVREIAGLRSDGNAPTWCLQNPSSCW